MTSNNNSHSSGSTSSANSKLGKKIARVEKENENLRQQLSARVFATQDEMACMPGGRFPGTNAYGIPYWSYVFRRPEGTITDWIRKYNIPYRGVDAAHGFVEAEDMLNKLPSKGFEDEAE
ncbi:hypothetical protein [Gimesia maris]|uniref:hypothetical protein n=1 Tax=Gimesia maris TaxID=122 RepID=UPI0032ED3B60